MRRSSTLERRVREIEEARGSGAVILEYPDGRTQGFHLARQTDELEILFAAIDIARSAADPDAPAPLETRFTRIAREVGKSVGTTTADREDLWQTTRELVRRAALKGDDHLEDQKNRAPL